MKVTVEPLSWLFRFHLEDDARYQDGSEYFANSTVTMDDTGTACIRGFAYEEATTEMRKALVDAFLEIGAKRVMYTRKRNGIPHTNIVTLRKKSRS